MLQCDVYSKRECARRGINTAVGAAADLRIVTFVGRDGQKIRGCGVEANALNNRLQTFYFKFVADGQIAQFQVAGVLHVAAVDVAERTGIGGQGKCVAGVGGRPRVLDGVEHVLGVARQF